MLRSWARDLAFGARLAVRGGREGTTRTVLTAVGVALAVAALLFAAAVPAMISARDERGAARMYRLSNAPVGPHTAQVVQADTVYYDANIYGVLMQADGAQPPIPPGVSTFPAPGDMVVSPALATLLASPQGALLRDRLDFRIAGTIAGNGLIGPGELAYYVGTADIGTGGDVVRINSYGKPVASSTLDSVLTLLILVGVLILLVPIALLIATSARFGGERRDRRLAALRLIGVDSRGVRRITVGETACGALAGMVLGLGFFLAARQFIEHVTLFGINAFTSDVTPSMSIAALIVVAVPAIALGATLLGLRGVAIEPLGVVRDAKLRRRRLWWRLVIPVVGLATLAPLASGSLQVGESLDTLQKYQICAGALLVLIGITAVLPWLVDLVVNNVGGGPVPWQLATRRLQLNSVGSARMVSGIVVAVAGAIALQMLFAGVANNYVGDGPAPAPNRLQIDDSFTDPAQANATVDRFRSTPGVASAAGLISGSAQTMAGAQADQDPIPVTVGDCAALAKIAVVGTCANGDVFLVPVNTAGADLGLAAVAAPGTRLNLTSSLNGTASGPAKPWTIPASARTVPPVPGSGDPTVGVLATPGALDASELQDGESVVLIDLDPQRADALEQVRNTAYKMNPGMFFNSSVTVGTTTDRRYSQILRGVLAGAIITLLIIGASLLISVMEQLKERKKLLAVLVAFGTRRSTLAMSVLFQTAIPVVLGLVLALIGGLGLGSVLLTMTSQPVSVNWLDVAGIVSIGAGMVVLVTLLSLPPLWRMMRPDGLRTE